MGKAVLFWAEKVRKSSRALIVSRYRRKLAGTMEAMTRSDGSILPLSPKEDTP